MRDQAHKRDGCKCLFGIAEFDKSKYSFTCLRHTSRCVKFLQVIHHDLGVSYLDCTQLTMSAVVSTRHVCLQSNILVGLGFSAWSIIYRCSPPSEHPAIKPFQTHEEGYFIEEGLALHIMLGTLASSRFRRTYIILTTIFGTCARCTRINPEPRSE